MDLQGKVAVVTGSSRGIGRAIALELASLGAKVVVNYRSSPDEAESVLQAIREAGGEATVIRADVSLSAEAKGLIDKATETYGGVDILVNNAGVTRDMLIMKMAEEDWDLVLDTNLKSAYNCSKAVIRGMMKKRYGRIINITSVVGLAGQAGQTNYAASKAGLIGFTKALAKEVGSRQVTVNAVAPGFISTAMTSVLPQEITEAAVKSTPLGRLGTPEDVAYVVAFLASEWAGFITGQVVSVDGGLAMH